MPDEGKPQGRASAEEKVPLAPGATLGILGGGQLGRMIALAAARLGYRSHIYCPQQDEPATQVTSRATIAAYDDRAALAAFARAVDVVTFEFENVPSETAHVLAENVPVRPRPEVLHICQNRLREKDFLAFIGVPTTRYAEVGDAAALARELRNLGAPAVLKSAEFGYDGKGQVLVRSDEEVPTAWDTMSGARSGSGESAGARGILEGFVDFRLEISVIVARGLDGQIATYVPVENQHRHHILDQTIAPARISPEAADRAEATARKIAEAIGLVGLLAVELFLLPDDRVLVNELAPRPHNSGHWTLDACHTSQFEQLVRAVAGLPLGSPERFADAVMKNLLGEEVERWRDYLAEPASRLHLYGKRQARPGRKMGHVTRIIPRR